MTTKEMKRLRDIVSDRNIRTAKESDAQYQLRVERELAMILSVKVATLRAGYVVKMPDRNVAYNLVEVRAQVKCVRCHQTSYEGSKFFHLKDCPAWSEPEYDI